MKLQSWLSIGVMMIGFGCHSSSGAGNGAGGSGNPGGGGSAATGQGGNAGIGNTGTGGGFDGSTLGTDAITKIPLGQTECSDGKDNDGDGLIDYDDPECIGPADDREGSFATGIPGDNMDACKQDCFFDGNSGMGDDGCEWQLKCDPLSPGQNIGCPYDSNFNNCPTQQSQRCINYCRQYTPNGCDCFGCCDIPGVGSLMLLNSCTSAKFSDPVACPRCTQSTSCNNVCERCELCIGKTTIPADCYMTTDAGTGYDGGGSYDGGYTRVCDNNYVPCGSGGVDPVSCPPGTGCVTGCCVPVVP